MEKYNLKEDLPRKSRKGTEANYIICVDGKPVYCGESSDVFTRLCNHRQGLKKGLFANDRSGKSGKPLFDDYDRVEILAYVFNLELRRELREELEELIHAVVDSLESTPKTFEQSKGWLGSKLKTVGRRGVIHRFLIDGSSIETGNLSRTARETGIPYLRLVRASKKSKNFIAKK